MLSVFNFNQAFKRVFSELQIYGAKKELTEEEKVDYSKLNAEYRKIIEASKPVDVSPKFNTTSGSTMVSIPSLISYILLFVVMYHYL